MASKLAQLRSKLTAASQLTGKHASACYRQTLEQNRCFVEQTGTNGLSSQFLFTRMACSQSFGKEVAFSDKGNSCVYAPMMHDKNCHSTTAFINQKGVLSKNFMRSYASNGRTFLTMNRNLTEKLMKSKSANVIAAVGTKLVQPGMDVARTGIDKSVHTDANVSEKSGVASININRPLSPHLSVYRPQINSTLSIFHRITGAFLSAAILSAFLLFEIGLTSLSFESVYQLSQSPILPLVGLIVTNLMILAMCYHVFWGIRHLVYDWSAGAQLFKKL
eukprot:TRINITY_DN643_c0_g1_i1.p1 TRINITY_DN643_c0_g1~~TRINITY_DN643_c0_g1_i1.p1  ORF type:complete len:276 (-),score=41.03 TRINITY_DN643_c0_g1_i1:321-1148(-)